MRRLLNIAAPFLLGVGLIGFWEWIVQARAIPPYVLPAPSAIMAALITDFPSLMASLLVTLTVTLEGFIAAYNKVASA